MPQSHFKHLESLQQFNSPKMTDKELKTEHTDGNTHQQQPRIHPRTVMLAFDGSPPSVSALSFLYSTILLPTDHLFVVAILPWTSQASESGDDFEMHYIHR